jgi:hypothetical protein
VRGASARASRIAEVVRGVVRQALVDSGCEGLYLRERASPEARLLARWLAADEPVGQLLGSAGAGALVADAANKTTLLLEPAPNGAAIAPLGDLYGSQIVELAGDCSLRGPARALAERCGLDALDAALGRCVDGHEDELAAFAPLDGAQAAAAVAAWRAARFARSRIGLVPKLGARTLGIDLMA